MPARRPAGRVRGRRRVHISQSPRARGGRRRARRILDPLGPRAGRLTKGRTSFAADADQLRRVEGALAGSHVAKLEERYDPRTPGADLLSYEIRHCGKDVFVDGFAIEERRVPARLLRLIDVLNDLVEPEVEKALKRRDD